MALDNSGWQVSQVATEFQINPRTLHYYERIGLLMASMRTPSGYRLYSSADRDRLRFILKAKATGLTLDEIRDILSLRRTGVAPCGHVRALVEAKVQQLDRHIAALAEFRQELVAMQREQSQATSATCVCAIIEGHRPDHPSESLRLAMEVLSRRPIRAGKEGR